MGRIIRTLAVAALLIALPAVGAGAGMLSVVSFDELPPDFGAGDTHRLGYSVLSHGSTPVDVGDTGVRFHGPDGETLVFAANADRVGHYTVEVVLPSDGEWTWEVVVGTDVLQRLGSIDVGAEAAVNVTPSAAVTWLRVILPAATALAILSLASQMLVSNGRRRSPKPVTDGV